MTHEELIVFMAERHVANYDAANDGSFGRKLTDFGSCEQKTVVDAMRRTLDDLSAVGFAIVPLEPTHGMVNAAVHYVSAETGLRIAAIEEGVRLAVVDGNLLRKEEPK